MTALTGHNGDTEQTVVYGPFGEQIGTSGTSPNVLGYTGRELDSETGLYYYRARYYDPEIGRFLSEDPLGFEAGDVNFYAYVSNNPINFNDPMGLETEVILSYKNWHGHSALRINNRVYSTGRYNPDATHSSGMKGDNIMYVIDHNQYVNRYKEQGIEAYGYKIDVTNSQEKQIQAYYDQLISESEPYKGGYKLSQDYSFLSENCTTNVCSGLQEGLSTLNDLWIESVSPHQLQFHLDTAPWLVNEKITYFDPSTQVNLQSVGAGGGYVLYPNKPNTNMMNSVYSK